ncbi:hypothetical protein BDB01DRAFT_885679 [Pilobolus umbonatus]|nr:hypothetical protein BDB01DRAFT_885679 [Pilobolus umbonatus]
MITISEKNVFYVYKERRPSVCPSHSIIMHFFSTLVLGVTLAISANASTLNRRQTSQCSNHISIIGGAFVQLKNIVDNHTVDNQTPSILMDWAGSFRNTISSGSMDCCSVETHVFSEEYTKEVFSDLLTLVPQIQEALDTLTTQVPIDAYGPALLLVRDDVKSTFVSVENCLTEKVPAEYKQVFEAYFSHAREVAINDPRLHPTN